MEYLKITINCRKNKTDELLRTCRVLTKQTRLINGCTSCGIAQSNANINRIILEQQWEKRDFMDNYFQSDLFTTLLGAMKWLGENYEVNINNGTKEDGMASVRNARLKI